MTERDCNTCKHHVQGCSLDDLPARCWDCNSAAKSLDDLAPLWEADLCKELTRRVNALTDAPKKDTWTEGVKFDQDKPAMALLDPYALEQIAKVLTFGAQKYSPDNWRKGIPLRRLLSAGLRHLMARIRGEKLDPESGLPHLAHLGCCVMFALWMDAFRSDLDDVYPYPQSGSTR